MGLRFAIAVLIIHYICFPHIYLNHAFAHFNQITTTIYLMYPLHLHVKEFTLLYKRTTEHTLRSRVKLSITQKSGLLFSVESQSKSMY